MAIPIPSRQVPRLDSSQIAEAAAIVRRLKSQAQDLRHFFETWETSEAEDPAASAAGGLSLIATVASEILTTLERW